jgi:GMP synthase (glutamine-hydrolysing)
MHILIFQGSPLESQRANGEFGGYTNEALFTTALQGRDACVTTFTLNVADGEAFPQGMGLADFDGCVITGSPLSTYEDSSAVRTQMELARDVFHAGIPTYGSCWGLQLMSAALGGDVRLNPKGREIGIARTIIVNDAGRQHAMFRDKPVAFDAFCSHRDEVKTLPEGSTVLAGNAVSDIQAAAIERGEKSFWGVQYHPEMNFGVAAMLMEKRAERYIAEGFARDVAGLAEVIADYRTLEKDGAARKDLLWRYGITPEVLDIDIRHAEFAGWLNAKVRPYLAAKA